MARGFTLIEILVVVVVVSIAMSVVVANFSGSDRQQEYSGHMHRLALKVEMARDKAVQRNREWGIHVDESGVRFSEYDQINGLWVMQSQRPFNAGEFAAELEYAVEVEAFAGIDISAETFAQNDQDETGFSLDENKLQDTDFPDVVIFSSGEVTPFKIQTEPKAWQSEPLILSSDGFTRVRVHRESEQGSD